MPFRKFLNTTYGLLGFFIFTSNLYAQYLPDHYTLESNVLISNKKNLPFWLMNNQWGRLSAGKYSINNGIGIFNKKDTTKIGFSYGAELVNNFAYESQPNYRFSQLFLQGKFFFINASIGRKHENFGCNKNVLTSGFPIYSNNAPPIPKLVIETDGFTSIPYTNDYLSFKAYFANGRLEEQRYIEKPFVHQKFLYGNIGGNFPLNAYFGFHHIALWGGKHPLHGELPVNWNVYKEILLAKSGSEQTTPFGGEMINKNGNHIGSRDIGITYDFSTFTTNVYLQTLFEDGSGKDWENFPDGLWGLSFSNKNHSALINKITLEYFHSTNQSGHVHDIDNSPPIDSIQNGNDNYFNHYIYSSGWSYLGYTIGTPFITSPFYDLNYSLTKHNDKTIVRYFPNNKVKSWYFGISGRISKLKYQFISSYSLNFGVNDPFMFFDENEANKIATIRDTYEKVQYKSFDEYYYRLPKVKQFSTLLNFSYPVNIVNHTFDFNAAISADFGSLLGDSWGVLLGLKKQGVMFYDH